MQAKKTLWASSDFFFPTVKKKPEYKIASVCAL